MINPIVKTIELPDGRTITLETGKLAKQADGSVMLRMGNTMLLATVCAAKDAVPGTDFMPLQVEYKEKFAAFGRFPGGFTKREGRASDYEILTCRLVDRALRPLFPDNYHAEVYVNIILFSADGVDMPDALAGLAASAALAVSDIPFNGPISEVRVARIDGQFVINPTFEQLEKADMDLMVAATYENIMMVEGEMHEVSEAELLEAMKVAHEAIKPMCQLQKELSKELGTDVKREYDDEVNDEELRQQVKDECYQPAYAIAEAGDHDKHQRDDGQLHDECEAAGESASIDEWFFFQPDIAVGCDHRWNANHHHFSERFHYAADSHAVAGVVQQDLMEAEHIGPFLRSRPAQRSTHPAEELHDAERLAQVVVRTVVQPLDDVDLAGFGRDHDDRRCGAGRVGAQLGQNLVAVLVGQHDVQNDEVGPPAAQRRPEAGRVLAARGLVPVGL